MAKNTGSTAFRRVDVDQYAEEKYEEESADDGIGGPSESEVQTMMAQYLFFLFYRGFIVNLFKVPSFHTVYILRIRESLSVKHACCETNVRSMMYPAGYGLAGIPSRIRLIVRLILRLDRDVRLPVSP
jgi:hypothetical protein